MPENLDIHLKEISKIILGLEKRNLDIKKLGELENSLELLSNYLKYTKLEHKRKETANGSANLKQDASIIFDQEFSLVRIIGSLENIFGNLKNNPKPDVFTFFEKTAKKEIQQQTKQLLQDDLIKTFSSNIISINNILLPVTVTLEKISIGNSTNLISAGLNFLHDNPNDLKDYQEILIENLPGLDVYLFDRDFRYILTGGKEKEKLKLKNTDFKGKTMFEIYDQKTQKKLFPFYRKTLDGNPSEGEIRIKNNFYVVNSTPIFDYKNHVAGGAMILQNITREKEIEQNLIEAKREAEEADKAKSLFLARMSHEIRTPLNSIIGFTRFLNKTELTLKQQKFSHLIKQSSEHLLSVVNEILFVLKLGMGKVFIEEIPFNLMELVQNVHELLLLQANKKDLKFDVEVENNIPEIFIGDPFRIKQILINLTSNAIKFTDKGYVIIKVKINGQKGKDVYIEFKVEDSGVGLSEKEMKLIFNEFAQIEERNEKNRKGTGLGLTISQRLVNLLKGELKVESQPQKGSVFSFTIPLELPQKHEIIPTEKNYNISFNLLEGKKILFADDDENNILLGEAILTEWKTDFELAYDGAETLKMLLNNKYDVALIDIHMPKEYGDEVVSKIRKNKNGPNYKSKMLAITANIMENDIEKYIKSGFDDYILKPFEEEKLYSKICALLNIPAEIKPKPMPLERSKKYDKIDTAALLKTSNGDFRFYNKMIDTFIENAKHTLHQFNENVNIENWHQIGEDAHKLISSFRYFGLTTLASKLSELENLALRKKQYGMIPEKVKKLSVEIGYSISKVKNERLPEIDKSL